MSHCHFKTDACHAVDVLSEKAGKAASVNTIWFTETGTCHGDTTDGIGLIRDLENHGISLTDKLVLIIGAGGAVRGVLPDLG